MYGEPDKKTMFLARYGSEKHIDKILDSGDLRDSYTEKIIENPMASKEQLNRMIPHASDLSYHGVRALASHPNIPDAVKHRIMDEEEFSGTLLTRLFKNPSFTKEDLHRLAKSPNAEGRIYNLIDHPHADSSLIPHFLENQNPRIKRAMLTPANQHISPEHVKTAMRDSDEFTRYKAIMHPHADIEELEHHAKHDPSDLVRLGAIKNKYAPKELIQHVAEHDPDSDNREAAKRILATK